MATGVKPLNEDHQFTRNDLEAIQDAMKSKQFRDLLSEYCEEVRNPANQAIYQKEMTQLEKERGYDVTFVNPKGGYVIKTSVAGNRKAFINICSSDKVQKPSYTVEDSNGCRGMNWKLPYSLIPPREDYDNKRERVVIYDVVFHPDTLRMAEVNKKFRELVNKTAFDNLQSTYGINLDENNFRFPKAVYKGMVIPAVIRKEDPNYVPPTEDESNELPPEVLEKLYPQHIHDSNPSIPTKSDFKINSLKSTLNKDEKLITSNDGYTTPKYVVKQQKNIDLQDFTYEKNSKQNSAIPSNLVIEIYMPLLSSTKDCILDIQDQSLSLRSEKPAKYKLNIKLPYPVNETSGSAKFDRTKRLLIVSLPVMKSNTIENSEFWKVDSGVESEENSAASQSDDDNVANKLIVELNSIVTGQSLNSEVTTIRESLVETFLDPTLCYILPTYTHNVLDEIVAFTFHIKNTEPNSVKFNQDSNKIYVKFSTMGSGFVPVYYGAIIVFEDSVKFVDISAESWDNNVILQMQIDGDVPEKCQIGLNENDMKIECFRLSQDKKPIKAPEVDEEVIIPSVEVTNMSTETNIVVSSKQNIYDGLESPISPQEKELIWIESSSCENGAKSILRKSHNMRSFSESSIGDIASSMDYMSSDCILEESSLKKTVRFSDVIAKQFYRFNSSIEGQKKKNQRKKSKKRQERLKSESEAEEETSNDTMVNKSRLKSAMKQRRDSGLADTSDAEVESKIVSSERNSSHMPGSNHELQDSDISSDLECHKSVLNIVSDEIFEEKLDKKEAIIKNPVGNSNDIPILETYPICETQSTMLNIVDNNINVKHKTIWKTEDMVGSDTRSSTSSKPDAKTCDNLKHNTSFYDPDKLNKGKYLEVNFKNDLIFDLDM